MKAESSTTKHESSECLDFSREAHRLVEKATGMEDEHHSPVSENRGAGDARTAGKNVLDRLHHELLLTDEPLGNEPDATLRLAHEKDKSPPIILRLRGRHVEHLL